MTLHRVIATLSRYAAAPLRWTRTERTIGPSKKPMGTYVYTSDDGHFRIEQMGGKTKLSRRPYFVVYLDGVRQGEEDTITEAKRLCEDLRDDM